MDAPPPAAPQGEEGPDLSGPPPSGVEVLLNVYDVVPADGSGSTAPITRLNNLVRCAARCAAYARSDHAPALHGVASVAMQQRACGSASASHAALAWCAHALRMRALAGPCKHTLKA